MTNAASSKLRVRQPRFADDLWYSSNEATLRARVEKYLAEAPPAPSPSGLVGLVAPHAGHRFSGHVAGASFGSLRPGLFNTVILLGPDHRGVAPNQISTRAVDVWRTPLGDIPVAWDILEALQTKLDLSLLPADDEHSLEIELPFLQVSLKQFRLVPLMMGNQSLEMCRWLSDALLEVDPALGPEGTGGRSLFVASSDLSHFFDDDTARGLDKTTLDFILKMDARGLLEHVEAGRRQGQPFACGAGPIAAVILVAQGLGVQQARLLKYATSADAHPSKDQVVGYAAVALSKEI